MRIQQPIPQRTQPRQLPPTPQRKRIRSPWLIVGGIAMLGFAALICVLSVLVLALIGADDTIADGVAVSGVVVGGMEPATARAELQTAFANRPVSLTDGDRVWDSNLAELGMQFNLVETFAAVEKANKNARLTPRYDLDLSRTQQAFIAMSAAVNIDAIPGRDEQWGRSMEIPVMLDRLRADAYSELSDGVFELTMMDIEPPEIETVDTYTGETTTHIVEAGQELALIAKEYGVDMADLVALNEITDANLIYPGQSLTIPAGGAFIPDETDAPPAPLQTGKSIVVDTNTQRIYAYQDGALIRSHLTSTGRAETPTVKGDYNIYVKFVSDDMSGPDYFLPDVPYTMYFYQGYGIHGTYWHNSFGRPMSHGCVNLPTDEAEWFFNFAEVGTLVRVI